MTSRMISIIALAFAIALPTAASACSSVETVSYQSSPETRSWISGHYEWVGEDYAYVPGHWLVTPAVCQETRVVTQRDCAETVVYANPPRTVIYERREPTVVYTRPACEPAVVYTHPAPSHRDRDWNRDRDHDRDRRGPQLHVDLPLPPVAILPLPLPIPFPVFGHHHR